MLVSTWDIVVQAREEAPEVGRDQHLEIPNYDLSTSWKAGH